MPVIPNLRLIVGGAVLIAFLTLFLLWKAADRRADKFQRQLIECVELRKKLERESREQQERTRTVIKQGKERIVYIDRKAKELESRPLPGGCRTPDLTAWKELL